MYAVFVASAGSSVGNIERDERRQAGADQVPRHGGLHPPPLGPAGGSRRQDHHRRARGAREHPEGQLQLVVNYLVGGCG